MRRMRSAACALAVIATAAIGLASSQPASAKNILLKDGTVAARPGLNVRSGPGGGSIVGSLPYGTHIALYCVEYGTAVTGPWGTETIWDYVSQNGVVGFVSDAWVYTGSSYAMAPVCNTDGRNI